MGINTIDWTLYSDYDVWDKWIVCIAYNGLTMLQVSWVIVFGLDDSSSLASKTELYSEWSWFWKAFAAKDSSTAQCFLTRDGYTRIITVVKWWNLCQNIFRGDTLEREHRRRDASREVGVYYAWFPVRNAEGMGEEPFTDKDEHSKTGVYSQPRNSAKAQGKFT